MKQGEDSIPVSANGTSVAAAINEIAATQNKQVSFAHCASITLGEGLINENIANLLQYFMFRTEMNNNCAIAWIEKGGQTTLEQFFKSYMRYTATSIIAHGHDQTAIFKSGVHSFNLDQTQTESLNFIFGNKIKKRLAHEHEVLHISRNSSHIKTYFHKGKPTAEINVCIKAQLESNPLASTATIKKIERDLKQQLQHDINNTVENIYPRTDVLGIYDKFYRHNTGDFKKYLGKNSFDEFMSSLEFKIRVDVSVTT